ncbi:MAG TPA: glycosyltransferase family 87 protein [Terracidiphilus sp.]|nr:glycosyltransferase family 87 protein [Terracidiphilus sp.]
MKSTRSIALLCLLLSGGISIWWGLAIGLNAEAPTLDFQAVYYGTRCLLEHHNPYKVAELEAAYQADGGERPSETLKDRHTVTLFVNLPTIFLFVAPLAILPWEAAQTIWLLFLCGVYILAAIVIWRLGESYAPGVSVFLISILLVESELTFATGNTAGVVVGLCLVSVWCFLQERFVTVAVLCLAASIAIKPHDAGLVWLYFLLAGGVHRKRALQALLITVVLSASALLWVTHIAPHWTQDWSANMASISGPTGLNNPGPGSVSGRTGGMVMDLQAAIAVFRDDPHIYNPVSYLICGALLLIWVVNTLRSRFSPAIALFALAAIVPLTMLVTYHRAYDAKLLLLTVPACAMLWAEGAPIRWLGLLVSTTCIVMTGEIPLAVLIYFTNNRHLDTDGIFGQMLRVVVTRPASLVLLAMAIFYLWVYVQRATNNKQIRSKETEGLLAAVEQGTRESAPMGNA